MDNFYNYYNEPFNKKLFLAGLLMAVGGGAVAFGAVSGLNVFYNPIILFVLALIAIFASIITLIGIWTVIGEIICLIRN